MEDYNQDIISSYTHYLYANNLYGLAMSRKLPYGDFQWSNDMRTNEHVLNYNNGDDGYILEVNLEYPKELHDSHSDYPLAAENMTVSTDMVSEFRKDIYKCYHDGKSVTDQTTKNKYETLEINVNMMFIFAILNMI